MHARIAALLFVVAGPLAAQSLLYVKDGDRLGLVQRAHDTTAFALMDGRWTAYEAGDFVLKPTEEYVPALVTVADPHFGKGARTISDDGTYEGRLVLAGRFVYTADLESAWALDDVVLYLAFKSPKFGNMSYICGVGHLDAHRRQRVSIDQKTSYRLQGVRLAGIHVFVGGREAFTSRMSAAARAAALDRMVAHRVAAVRDAALQPLYFWTPAYPAELKSKTKGQAVIAFRVDERGDVLDPTVKSAGDPAFGVAAVETIRQWRFVPQVRGGAAVETTAELPFVFAAPD